LTSTVGFPRESSISNAIYFLMNLNYQQIILFVISMSLFISASYSSAYFFGNVP
jgi:hypothetical protein